MVSLCPYGMICCGTDGKIGCGTHDNVGCGKNGMVGCDSQGMVGRASLRMVDWHRWYGLVYQIQLSATHLILY